MDENSKQPDLEARMAKLEGQVNAAHERADNVAFWKRAQSELQHLPGTVEEHAAVLKAMFKMDEAPRKWLEAILKDANDATGALARLGLKAMTAHERRAFLANDD